MNQILLIWGHYPDTEIYIALPEGMTLLQLRHYARQCGFLDIQDLYGDPALAGYSLDQKDALRCTLEAAGYDVREGIACLSHHDPLYVCIGEASL